MLLAWSAARAADEIDRLIDTLHSARSFKVRVQAASVLSRMKDPRVIPALGRAALQDRHLSVRAYAVRLLGKNPGGDPDGEQARALLRRALRDRRSDVRVQASRALAEVDRRQAQITAATAARRRREGLVISVRGMGDRTGKAGRALRDQLKQAIIANLRRESGITIAGPSTLDPNYIIDGTIARLEHGPSGQEIESLCAVELVVSRPPRGIIMVASGEASVLKPRIQFRPAFRATMTAEALDHAAKSAHDNLARFLAAAAK